jgi:hypothetical protein
MLVPVASPNIGWAETGRHGDSPTTGSPFPFPDMIDLETLDTSENGC